MQTIIHDTTIATVDEQGAVHYDAAIAIAEDRIAAIGPNAELLARYPAAERIDGRGKAVLPGFANTHTHLGLTLARGVYEDLSPSHTIGRAAWRRLFEARPELQPPCGFHRARDEE